MLPFTISLKNNAAQLSQNSFSKELPVTFYLDLDIAIGLMADELLGPLLDDFRFHERSEGRHGA